MRRPTPEAAPSGEALAAEASLLVATYEPETWNRIAPAWDEFASGSYDDYVVLSGEYGRWMQDARAWALQALRAHDSPGDPYRTDARANESLRRAGRAVLDAVTGDSAFEVVSALQRYLTSVRDPSNR